MSSVLRPLIRVRPLKSQWRRLNSPPIGFPFQRQFQDEPLLRSISYASNIEEPAGFNTFHEPTFQERVTHSRQRESSVLESQLIAHEEQDLLVTSKVDQSTINHYLDDLLVARTETPLHQIYSLDEFELQSDIEDVLRSAVESRDGDVLLPALLDASRVPEFLSAVSVESFAGFLDILKDNILVKKAKEGFHLIHPWHYRDLPDGRRHVREILDDHEQALLELLARWRQSGRDADTNHFRFLLRLAVEVEDIDLAKSSMKALEDSGYRPTSDDLGNYLEVICYNAARNPHSMQLRRVSLYTRNIRILRTRQEYSKFVTHHVPADGLDLEDSLAVDVNKVWQKMQQYKVKPTETMMRMILVAQSRQGNIDGVAETLLRYWGIDMLAKTVPTKSHISYARENGYDLFVPTLEFCRDLAHALGVNGQSPLSMTLLDQISQHHDLVLDEAVWYELLTYCYLQSTARANFENKLALTGKPINRLDFKSPLDLWQIMRAEPYNIKPTMEMLNILAITARNIKYENERSIEALYEGDDIQKELDAKARVIALNLQEKVETTLQSVHDLVRTRRNAEVTLIERFSGHIRMQKWFRLGLSSSRARRDIEWRHRGVQDFILRFWRYRPTGVVGHGIGYETKDYHIFLHEGRARENVKVASCDDKSAVTVQAREQYYGISRLPHTRSMKLYWRWVKRMTNPANARLGPLYLPQWFEAPDVKDWNELEPQYPEVYSELKASRPGHRPATKMFAGR